jgi:hypothetical protein
MFFKKYEQTIKKNNLKNVKKINHFVHEVSLQDTVIAIIEVTL